MPTYIMLSTLTDEGRKTVKMRPERIKEVNDEIEKMGAKVLEQYAVLGEYDFVNILEAPDNETISKVSIELGSRGTIQLITLAAMPIDELAGTLSSQ
ncbi:MAG: GYD domain-containing protein [Thermodesulfobacteriota bacterium]|nr:GYD domain-containing protein [Thermodesulfobacteriota bacterium]|tara:strand:+ start:571 stop:861 length:291 start_codon:yes stop_codon:yes gene_type:complete